MEGKASYDEMERRDLYWLLDINEALDVHRDMNDLDVREPFPEGYKGTQWVR